MRQDTDGMSSKEKYEIFCTKTYVPVFSKPWWMDAVCGPDRSEERRVGKECSEPV